MSANQPEFPRNPYVGPQPFQRADKDFFFGRSLEASQLLALVLSERIVLFYAPSGAGKSSLINASLLDTLENQYHFFVLPVVRLSGKRSFALDTPKVPNIFIDNLLHDLDSKTPGPDKPSLTPDLTLTEYLARYREQIISPQLSSVENLESTPKILIVDQFEELFTYYPEEWQKREDLFIQLHQALEDDPRLWILLAFREDFVAAIDPYAYLFPGRLRARFYMQRLAEKAARDAISRPAEVAGRKFDPAAVDELVHRLLHIPSDNPDLDLQDQFVEPLILQVVCYYLWESLAAKPFSDPINPADLQLAGDVDSALERYYDDWVIQRLLVEDQPTAPEPLSELRLRQWIEKHLFSPELQRNFVYEKDAGLPLWALHSLYKRRLLCQGIRDERLWYELAHDRLVHPVHLSNQRWLSLNLPPLLRTVETWVREKKPPDYLVGGKLLQEYEEWAHLNNDLADPNVALFLERSRLVEDEHNRQIEQAKQAAIAQMQSTEEKKRLKQRNRYNLVLLGIFMLILLGLVMYFYRGSLQSSRDVRYTLSQRNGMDSQEISPGQPVTKLIEAVRALRITQAHADYESSDARHAAYAALANLVLYQPYSEAPRVTNLAVSLDGRLAAVIGRQVFAWEAAQLAKAAGQVAGSPAHARFVLDLPGEQYSLAFSPDGWLAAAGPSETSAIRLWNLSGDDLSAPALDLPAQLVPPILVKFSPDGRWLAAAGNDGVIQLWDRTDLASQPLRLLGHYGTVTALDFSSRLPWLASGGADGQTMLWNLTVPDPSAAPLLLPDHGAAVTALAFSPDGRWLATGNSLGIVRLWDAAAPDPGRSSTILNGHAPSFPINKLAFHPNGQWLASASGDSTVCLWELGDPSAVEITAASFACEPRLAGYANSVLALAFDPDQPWLVSGDSNGGLWMWSGPAGSSQILADLPDPITDIAFDPRRAWFATLEESGRLSLWDISHIPTPVLPVVLPEVAPDLTSLAVSPDERWLVGLDRTGQVNRWQIENLTKGLQVITPYHSAAELAQLAGYTGAFGGAAFEYDPLLAFYPSGRWLATAAYSGKVFLWDMDQAQPISQSLGVNLNFIKSLVFDPSGSLLAAAGAVEQSQANAIQLWRIRRLSRPDSLAADPLAPLAVQTPSIARLAFSPDGRWLAAGGASGFLSVSELSEGQPAGPPLALSAHQSDLLQLAYTPDSKWLASADAAGRIFIWNLKHLDRPPYDLSARISRSFAQAEESGQPVALGRITGLAASSDGEWLAVAAADPSPVWLLDLSSGWPDAAPPDASPASPGDPALYSLDCDRTNSGGLSFIQEKPSTDPPAIALRKRLLTVLGFDDLLPAGADRLLAVAYPDGICIWDLRDPAGAPITLGEGTQPVTALTTGPHGEWLAGAAAGGQVSIWPLDIAVIDRLVCQAFKDSLDGQNLSSDIRELYADCFPSGVPVP